MATRSDPTDDDPGRERIVAFLSAVERGDLWFLSMLFVLPEEQASGVGPPAPRARAAGSGSRHDPGDRHGQRPAHLQRPVQPVRHGAEDAAPGPDRRAAPTRAAAVAAGRCHRHVRSRTWSARRPPARRGRPSRARRDRQRPGPGHARRGASAGSRLDADDGATRLPLSLGEWRRTGLRLRLAGRSGRAGRGGGSGSAGARGRPPHADRPGPRLVRDLDPGHAGEPVRTLLDAGLRLEPFPILLCWSEALTDYTRYIPISPGLL